jgi:hypothetical protein
MINMTLEQSLPLVLVGIAFIMLYIFDKDSLLKGKTSDDKNMLLRYIFLLVGISFFYMALILNYTAVQTVTTQAIVGGVTTFTTNYIYNNTQIYVSQNFATVDLSFTFVIYTIIYIIIMAFTIMVAYFDMADVLVENTDFT